MREVRNWKRLLAFLVDFAIVDLVIVRPLNEIIENPLVNIKNVNEIFSLQFSMNLFLISLLIGVLGILYWSILEYNLSQTIGAMLFGIKVRSIDNKKIDFRRILIRNLSKINSTLLIIDDIGIFTSSKKQRYLERASSTITVEEK